jgi:hypothetical protein
MKPIDDYRLDPMASSCNAAMLSGVLSRDKAVPGCSGLGGNKCFIGQPCF